jgi:hypothetical protein
VKKLTIKFIVTGYPEASGLRIRSTEPVGLYVSSADPEAAQWWFERQVVELVAERKVLHREKGEGLAPVLEIDWNEALMSGCGKMIIRTMSVSEVMDTIREGTLDIIPPVKKLLVEWWPGRNNLQTICVVRDNKKTIDSWIVKSMKEDSKNGKLFKALS